jgi:hypothetical protein
LPFFPEKKYLFTVPLLNSLELRNGLYFSMGYTVRTGERERERERERESRLIY